VGDATNDYKDYYELDTINYVPTQLIDTTTVGLAASDLWYVLLNGSDDIPDMFIGRLSAQTDEQVNDIVAKIINYENFPPAAPWNKNVLLVADHDGDYDFEGTSDQVAAKVTADYTVNKVYKRDYPTGDPAIDIATYINNGSLLVNYVGHGDMIHWGYKSIFWDIDDVTALNNTNKLPVATLGNCLNGAFSHPSKNVSVVMAEEFQRRPNKGAVAVWAATSWSYASGHHVLLTSFYDVIFQQQEYRLGQVVKQADMVALNAGWNDQVKTFVFFGDPATQLGGSSAGPGSGPVYLPIVIKGS
jgi:hypothetical protein